MIAVVCIVNSFDFDFNGAISGSVSPPQNFVCVGIVISRFLATWKISWFCAHLRSVFLRLDICSKSQYKKTLFPHVLPSKVPVRSS
jgi:hypothetical protein